MSDEDSHPPLTHTRRKLALLLLLSLAALALLLPRTTSRSELQDDLSHISLAIEADGGSQIMYRSGNVTAGVFPGHGFNITLFVGDLPPFHPAEFLTIANIQGVYHSELIIPAPLEPGVPLNPQHLKPEHARNNFQRLEHDDTLALIQHTQLDISRFVSAFQLVSH